MSFQETHAYQHAAAEKAQEDFAAAPKKAADEAAVKRHADALQALSRAQAVLATAVVACERYDATAWFMKWGNHFIAKDGSCCAFAGSKETAVLRAKERIDTKRKVVMVDQHCRTRAINDHEGRRFAIGLFNTSLPEHVFAFENAALRDTWVAMLQAIPAAPAAVVAAQGEIEVRCFSPRTRPWLTGQNTPLHFSASNDRLEVSRLLLQCNANIEAKNDFLQTPLHCSARMNLLDIARLLVESKADLAAKDSFGRTALRYTIVGNKADFAAYLRSVDAPE